MAEFFIIYIIGYIISFYNFFRDSRKDDDIRLCDLLLIIFASLFSWLGILVILIMTFSQYVVDNWNVIIFKKKNNGNKD